MDFQKLLYDFLVAISPALQTLLAAVFTGLASYLMLWVKAKFEIEKNKLSQEQQYLLNLFARNAVQAAEQMYSDNAEKRDYAVSIVEQKLEFVGLKLDLKVIISAVEAAVFNGKKNNFLEG